ncbi:MAG TPA: hypothetical protein VGN63_07680 [Flavisolibacter sp.]|jgi:hypothetical protein|nr:hypothetical protein [Flavisolibacter sp.]
MRYEKEAKTTAYRGMNIFADRAFIECTSAEQGFHLALMPTHPLMKNHLKREEVPTRFDFTRGEWKAGSLVLELGIVINAVNSR